MSDKDLKAETMKWLNKLNKKFGNIKGDLIKTGGKNTENQNKLRKLPDKKKDVIYNETTNDSLNYANQEGTLR